jgi:hypothetical protein
MKLDNHAPKQANPFELYRPIAEWVVSLYNENDKSDDGLRRYFLALDKIVRHADFDIEMLRKTMVGGWIDFAEQPEDQEAIEYLCLSASTVRQYLEARGEATKKPEEPKMPKGQTIH